MHHVGAAIDHRRVHCSNQAEPYVRSSRPTSHSHPNRRLIECHGAVNVVYDWQYPHLSRLNQMIAWWESGYRVDMSDEPQLAAALLREYLLRLPQPLIPASIVQSMLAFNKSTCTRAARTFPCWRPNACRLTSGDVRAHRAGPAHLAQKLESLRSEFMRMDTNAHLLAMSIVRLLNSLLRAAASTTTTVKLLGELFSTIFIGETPQVPILERALLAQTLIIFGDALFASVGDATSRRSSSYFVAVDDRVTDNARESTHLRRTKSTWLARWPTRCSSKRAP